MKWQMDSVLGFGKWQGFTVEEVIKVDSQYVEWMTRNFIKDEFDAEVIDRLLFI